MAYNGPPSNGNGYWPGQHAPNAYAAQESRSFLPPRPPGASQQYQASSNNDGYYNQNDHMQYMTMNPSQDYANNAFYAQAPASQPSIEQQPQFISPAQLFQQPTVSPSSLFSNSSPHISQTPSNLASHSASRMAPLPASNSEPDMPMLLVSLAEEYFAAAHELAPAAALSMSTTDVAAYQQLIATGLACLDTALKNVRLAPRLEANIILRYAGVLFDETENSMEAEMALTKGIALCERNHYYDLKYAMQFLLARFMAKKNPKASMKALDGHISEVQAYQHLSWIYVFRFLRASIALENNTLIDHTVALQNLRAIASLAKQQNDNAIHLTASLMEALAYMKTSGPDAIEHVQTALAAAYSSQLNPACKIQHLVCLTHILDVACALRKGNFQEAIPKLRELRTVIDAAGHDPSGGSIYNNVISVPINWTPKSGDFASQDTRMVLGLGKHGGDNLMLTFLSMKDAYLISCFLGGIILNYTKPSEREGINLLNQGLESFKVEQIGTSRRGPGPLPEFVSKRHWGAELCTYYRVSLAFYSAALADWPNTKQQIDDLRAHVETFDISLVGPLGQLILYLDGVNHQGIGDFDKALQIFGDARFNLTTGKSTAWTSAEQVERDIALLAALNTLWILLDKQRRDHQRNIALTERIEPYCASHANLDIRIAFNLILATVKASSPNSLHEVKNPLGVALRLAKVTNNLHLLAIVFSVTSDRFYNNIIGPQAEKIAMAASATAAKSGNKLWMSVADGVLARFYEVQGRNGLAQTTLERAHRLSEEALPDI